MTEEFDEQLECSKENTKKYINDIGNCKTVICKVKLINSIRFLAKSLSSLTDNLAERTYQQLKQIISIWKIMSRINTPLISCIGAWLIFKDEQCHRNCLQIVSNGEKTSKNFLQNS